MDKEIIDYTYLSWTDTSEGMDKYRKTSHQLIKDGWKPFGGVSVSKYSNQVAVNIFAQAFVKYGDIEF